MIEGDRAEFGRRYDAVAPRWRDKMRALGYYDGYLGFLSAPGQRAAPGCRVIDVGAGSAAFSEAWVAVNGAPGEMVLLDPSAAMLERGRAILAERGVAARACLGLLGQARDLGGMDEVLAAHVLEHLPDPAAGLAEMRALLRPGGRLRLVVSKPHWCNAIIWVQWRHRTFSEPEARALLAGAGFALEAAYDFPAGPPSRTSRGFVARAA